MAAAQGWTIGGRFSVTRMGKTFVNDGSEARCHACADTFLRAAWRAMPASKRKSTVLRPLGTLETPTHCVGCNREIG